MVKPDDKLIELAQARNRELGLARPGGNRGWHGGPHAKGLSDVPRNWYTEQVDVIRRYLEKSYQFAVGRPERHAQIQQSGPLDDDRNLCGRNICGANHDLWAINTEPDYQEEKRSEPAKVPLRPAYAEPPLIEQKMPSLRPDVSVSSD